MTQLEKAHAHVTQNMDQLWAHLQKEINAEAGLDMHLKKWAKGDKAKLSFEDKANIRLFTYVGLMYVQAMNLRQAIVEGT